MAPFSKTTFVTGSTPAASASELNNLGDGIVEAQRAPLVTALPTTGPGGGALVDGQECYYLADAVAGVVWHLKYQKFLADGVTANPSAYKWVCLGGSQLQKGPISQNVGGDTFNNGAGYLAASNTGGTGPDITIPLAGDYDVTVSAYIRHGAAGGSMFYSYSLPGGIAPSDTDALYITMSASNVPDLRASLTRRKTGLASGTLSSRYKASGGSSVGLVDAREIAARPVRVG